MHSPENEQKETPTQIALIGQEKIEVDDLRRRNAEALAMLSVYLQWQNPGQKFFKCRNCGAELPFSSDPVTDHHTAQRHNVEACTVDRGQIERDRLQLLADFNEQQLIQQFERKRTTTRRPWWQFWKRNAA